MTGAVRGVARDRLAAPQLLIERYGAEAPAVVALAATNPELARPVAPGADVLAAEFVWSLEQEGALDAGDLLDRRTRIGLVPADRAAALAAAEAAVAGTTV